MLDVNKFPEHSKTHHTDNKTFYFYYSKFHAKDLERSSDRWPVWRSLFCMKLRVTGKTFFYVRVVLFVVHIPRICTFFCSSDCGKQHWQQVGWSPWSPQASYDRRRHRNCFPTRKSASISEKVNISWGHRSVDALFTCVDLHCTSE